MHFVQPAQDPFRHFEALIFLKQVEARPVDLGQFAYEASAARRNSFDIRFAHGAILAVSTERPTGCTPEACVRRALTPIARRLAAIQFA